MREYEKMAEKLKMKGYRLTPQRLEIMKVIEKYEGKHPALKELMEEVKKTMPTVSFSTLYNTMMKFEETGLIYLFTVGGETRVETEIKPHINIIDRKSGRINDLYDKNLIKNIEKKVKDKNILVNVIVY